MDHKGWIGVAYCLLLAETYSGMFGPLDMQYWVLDHQRERAMKHFREAPRVMQAFEYWFGNSVSMKDTADMWIHVSR